MVEASLAVDLIFVLAAAFVGGSLAVVFRQPVIAGYLVGGLIFGPQALGLIHESADIKTLAEIGIVLLMFTLGLESSLPQLKSHSKILAMGVAIQLGALTLTGLIFAPLFSWSVGQSLFFGLMLAFSSTAVAIKALLAKGELDSTHGKLATSWLILEDLMILPTLIVLSSLGGQNLFLDLGTGLLKAAVFLVVALFIGIRFAPKILGQIAASGSREIFILASIILALGIAFLTNQFGLSFAMGGYLAGIVLSDSQFREQVFADVKNVRDLFAVLFFVSVGMLVGPIFILQNLIPALVVLLVMSVVKLLIITTWIYKFGYHLRTAMLSGAALLQVGEFSFVIATLGVSKGFIDSSQYQLILTVAIISLILTPFYVRMSPRLYHLVREFVFKKLPQFQHLFFTGYVSDRTSEVVELSSHIVVIGYGRVGRFLSHALLAAKVSHVISDLDPKRLIEPQSKGVPTVYGDASEEEILDLMRVKQARAVVITHGEIVATKMIISRVRAMNPNIKILARAHDDDDVAALKSLAIYRVIQPEFEASLTMTHKLLDFLNIPKDEEKDLLLRLRREHHG